MRRALFAVSSTIAGLVMLLSFKTQPATVGTPVAAAPDPATAAGTTPAPAGTSGGTSAGTSTVLGDAADTRWGPVQVQITVTDGTVTAVAAVEYPQSNQRDVEINQYAVPQLNQEATAARSTQIDMVSGATYTSQGYIQSLQSALDKAGL